MPHDPSGKPTVTRDDIIAGLRALGINQGHRMFVHSSLSAFGHVIGGADAVVDALIETVGPAGTAAVPTFTWRANHNADTVVFDVRQTPTELGIVPETFRRRPEALRDEHVCHSIAAIGADASAVTGDGVRPFAWGSGMYRLYEMDFWYVFLGCGFNSCTALHTCEELMQVPYRAYRDFRGSTVIRADGTAAPSKSIEFLCRPPYHSDLAKMAPVFEQQGILRTTRVSHARIVAAKARDIVDIGTRMLEADIGAFLGDDCRELFERHREELESGSA
ncbi:MAG: AAC(3) family N-acetyltransferase [Phycisphaerae bacterium]|nr:AAC(3) family N-acetyltransferase [Phycisphaerae bacterium]